MPPKIIIGEMARMHGISTQTLRYYDRINLFKPSYTDQENGYRYYGIEQFAHLESILFLKGLGMSLQDIKKYFKNRDLKSMLELMENRLSRLDAEVLNLEMKRKKIASLFSTIRNYQNHDVLGKCHLQKMPERRILFFHFGGGDIVSEHEFGIKKLENVLENVDDLYLNPFGTVISKDALQTKSYEIFKGIAMVFDADIPKRPGTLPMQTGSYACMAFVGTYKEVSGYCAQLVDWINKQNLEIIGDGIILVVTDKAYSDFEYEYVSEIQVPVRKIRT
ncbi:MerR family transcriptional regulator [Ethanoligenens harbinense]|uniref:Transcriptional regulator, MerR family n=1 Tax=Ethanoligenens harbinense (strain DSM 18485 / JCM 12961 / CGMCC 1.5033 / YUAN-3) TaxID=663278 RepID=E6U587_ETHHY|nr:MerR family transcriptional regulator [Ethanoligenens harbinense]ADU27900.1 transcriptional regulator, MerR family [Ethanoligenens harbinense YUAN-3]AVQ96929.1 MerR family transcriptional regulator [Ethanoligenens harbinense YUAN-3]AYF39590.1 MerR family transcriptional regulator [Ethanoligenens harbinense]AYF42416.1 MerR family transcriptional regulator [Ethanoligenens harbinense]QCN93169.1 MerR family transcriptional regulator [Ethanoligenens harbinense]